MTIHQKQEAGKMTVSLEGRLDTMTAPVLQDGLIPLFDTQPNIVLDCAGLSYVSSAGLRVLLTGQKTAVAKQGKLTLTNVSSEIMEVFEVTGFSGILTIE